MVLIEIEYLIESKSRMKDLEFLNVLFFKGIISILIC